MTVIKDENDPKTTSHTEEKIGLIIKIHSYETSHRVTLGPEKWIHDTYTVTTLEMLVDQDDVTPDLRERVKIEFGSYVGSEVLKTHAKYTKIVEPKTGHFPISQNGSVKQITVIQELVPLPNTLCRESFPSYKATNLRYEDHSQNL